MTDRYLEVTYRRGRPLAAYLYLPRREGDRCSRVEELPEGLVVDLATDGRAIGIEILDPDSATLDRINAVLRKYGMEEMLEQDLSPLRTAA